MLQCCELFVLGDGLRTAISRFAKPIQYPGKIITLELIVALGRSICDICSMCMSNSFCGYIIPYL